MTRAHRQRLPRLGPHQEQGEVAADIAADARASAGELAAAWSWLTALRQPGAPGPRATRARPAGTPPPGAGWRDDRRAALAAVRAGSKPAGPHATPANLHIVDARARIADQVADLAARLWSALYGSGLLYFVREPAPSRADRPCTACRGLGVLDMPYAGVGVLSAAELTPPDPVACPHCRAGIVRPASTCPACHTAGPCECDRADVAMSLHLATIDDLLGAVDIHSAADADQTLADLAAYATSVAGAGRDHRRLPGLECPVCGGRDLTAEVSAVDTRRWSITCHGPDCVCAGPGCDCGIGTDRRAGRRHRWPGVALWALRDQTQRAGALPAVLADLLRRTVGLNPNPKEGT